MLRPMKPLFKLLVTLILNLGAIVIRVVAVDPSLLALLPETSWRLKRPTNLYGLQI